MTEKCLLKALTTLITMKNNDNYKPWEYRPIKTTENGFCLIDDFYR